MQKIFRRIDPDLLSILALLALGLVAYANSFNGVFQYDDFHHILKNEALFDLTDLSRIFHYGKGRFLPYLTLALNYKISKFHPISYHTFNFFVHYSAAIFLYFLVLEICKTPAIQSAQLNLPERLGAFLAAGIFLLHPLQTESVTYIIQRAESMAGMFYLAALFFYVKARNAGTRRGLWGYAILAGIAALSAAFSKETSATLPVMIMVFELFFFNTSLKDLFRKKLLWIMMIPAVIILSFKIKPLIRTDFFFDPGPGISLTRKQYLLTQFSVLLTYLRLFFWPAKQNIDWDYPVATSFLSPQTIASFLLLLLLLILAYFTYRRLRLVSLGIIAFFITLAPTSSIIPLRDVIFEHRMYIAVAFLAIAGVQVLFYGTERVRKILPPARAIIPIGSIIVLLSLLTGLTQARNKVWLSELSLWEDAVKKSPNKARAHSNYGRGLFALKNKVSEKAKREFETAIRLSPDWAVPYHNLAICHFQEGDYPQAIALDLQALKKMPNYSEVLYQLGRSYRKLNQWDESRLYLERLIGRSPGAEFIKAYVDLLEVYLELGLQDEAVNLAQAMVQLRDGRLSLDYYRGLAFYKLNDMSKAKLYFTKQIEREPRRLPAYLMLGYIPYQQEEYEEAEMAFRKAIEEQKWSAEAHYNLAILLERDGRLLEASEHLEKVVAVDPFTIDASVHLVILYARLANPSKQTERLRKLLGLHPRSAEYAFLRENQSQDLRRLLYAYEDEFLSKDNSPLSLKKKAIVATLREEYGEAIERYQNYLETVESKREKKRITNEMLRLEQRLQGREPLRTSV